MKVDDWTLVNAKTGVEVSVGDEVVTFRGDKCVLSGGRPPAHSASTGRVYVKANPDGYAAEYFPSVVGAKWVRG